ncbi:MAG: hypothetical protein KNN13_07175 [Hydrogenobacter thermophilus]|uniref:hypothetical protein n=1 Tax=Hydrogenobacter thermophilus TaxID=940 RepID=UPI001C75A9D0|nr:hypothetical protein [Hydrogenobacter thermophilus]QWK20766.1 MAG: hypothetical protein KNN13_07175 [Hydrogenobacter thermophilus]
MTAFFTKRLCIKEDLLKVFYALSWEKRGKWSYYRINPHNPVMAQLRPLIESLATSNNFYSTCEVQL